MNSSVQNLVIPNVSDYAAYAGIGSRETPPEILGLMKGIAAMLDDKGYVLRTGGAEGADTAFLNGTSAMSHPEIFVPWDGFNGYRMRIVHSAGKLKEAMELARRFHPNWEACSQGARKLHARNGFQVLGADLREPAKFVVCWTKGGKIVGGTGQALRIAEENNIPVYNLAIEEVRVAFYYHLGWEH